MNIPEMTQADLAEIAFNLGVVLAADAHKVLMHAIAARDAQWNALIAGQAGEAVADDSFEFEAPGLRSFGMKVPSPMEYGKKCYERGVLAGKAQALASLPAPQVAQAGHHEEQTDGTVTPVDPTDRGFKTEQALASSDPEGHCQAIADHEAEQAEAPFKNCDRCDTPMACRDHDDRFCTSKPTASAAGEREAYVTWLSDTYPDAWTREAAEHNWRYQHVSMLAWQARAALASKPPQAEQKPQAEYLDKLIDRLKLPPESMTAKQHIELCDEAAAMLHLLKKNSHPEPVAPPAREGDSYDAIWNALQRIDSAAAMLPTYTVDHEGGIEAFTQNIVDAITRLTPPAQAVQTEDTKLLNWLRDECCDLRCISVPTSGDDYDVRWVVIQHHMAEPREREVGGSFTDEPRDAIRAARTRGDEVNQK